MTLHKLNPTEAEKATLEKSDALIAMSRKADATRALDFAESMKPTELPPPPDMQF